MHNSRSNSYFSRWSDNNSRICNQLKFHGRLFRFIYLVILFSIIFDLLKKGFRCRKRVTNESTSSQKLALNLHIKCNLLLCAFLYIFKYWECVFCIRFFVNKMLDLNKFQRFHFKINRYYLVCCDIFNDHHITRRNLLHNTEIDCPMNHLSSWIMIQVFFTNFHSFFLDFLNL